MLPRPRIAPESFKTSPFQKREGAGKAAFALSLFLSVGITRDSKAGWQTNRF